MRASQDEAQDPQFVILYPVAFTIGCQNAVLAASSFVRPSGVEPTGIRPIAASFSLTSGLASAVATASLSFFAKSDDAPAGRNGDRVSLPTARIRTLPARCCGMASVNVEIANGIWPPTRSLMIGALPR